MLISGRKRRDWQFEWNFLGWKFFLGGGVNGMKVNNGNKKWIKNKKEVSKNMVSGIALKE